MDASEEFNGVKEHFPAVLIARFIVKQLQSSDLQGAVNLGPPIAAVSPRH